jgi:hypothetical protein
MGRKSALVGFWIVGYALGFFAWTMRAPVLRLIENVGLSAQTGEAIVAGLFGSTVMVIAVLLWSFFSAS